MIENRKPTYRFVQTTEYKDRDGKKQTHTHEKLFYHSGISTVDLDMAKTELGGLPIDSELKEITKQEYKIEPVEDDEDSEDEE